MFDLVDTLTLPRVVIKCVDLRKKMTSEFRFASTKERFL